MRYCVPLFRNYQFSNKIKDVDEFLIRYRPTDETLFEFLETYPNKRIILSIEDREEKVQDYGKFQPTLLRVDTVSMESQLHRFDIENIHDKYPNLVLRLGHIPEQKYLDWLKERNIPYFFSTLVRDWDTLNYYVGLGVTDIYIVEALAFELDKVRNITKGINIRCLPNVAQCSVPKTEAPYYNLSPMKDFFIRPEDVSVYEPYVDVLEIWGWEDSRAATLYDIYAHDKKWYGQLNEIIFGLDSKIDSRFVIPRFANYRIKCGKRCLKGVNCDICNNIERLAEILEENNLKFTKEAADAPEFKNEEDTSLE